VPFAVFVLCATGATALADDPARVWVGRCRWGGADVFLRLALKSHADSLHGVAFSRRLGVRNAPLTGARGEGNRAALSFPTDRGVVHLSCSVRGDELEGTAEIDGSAGPCAFRRRYQMAMTAFDAFRGDYRLGPDRILFVHGGYDWANQLSLTDGDVRVAITPVGPRTFLAEDLRTITFEADAGGTIVAAVVEEPGQEPRRAPRVRLYEQEPVTFPSGDVRLAGVLTLPPGPGPHPALVFVHGSGAGTRYQYAAEMDRFARHGIAVLAYDKRGSGESTGDWRRADFDELADDVLAAVAFLRRDPRIRADKIGLWGISQAGWIIPLAAARSRDVAFLVPISGGAVTPAEQEVWRQRQNLQFLGVDERFIEAERKAALLGYDWDRQIRLGRMPLPQPFADDNLNMFHDAPAVLRRVRQPVLAIFGGLDTLTPPRESAALWAEALRASGHPDYSVRLFPRGSHGLWDGGKTGSPLEVWPEMRWVPGYFDTMVRWVHHHVDGPEFAQARQVDVDPDHIPVESRGMHEVSWYGSGAVQPSLLVVLLAAFASAALAAPATWIRRRVRRVQEPQPVGARRTQWLAALLGLLNLAILTAMTYVLYQLVMAVPHPVVDRLGLIWNALAAATWLSLLLVVLVGVGTALAWRHGWWSRIGRLYYTLIALAGLVWVPFVLYWDLARPTW
jgi:dienelactone hydrolase